jgi:hypothetical protein
VSAGETKASGYRPASRHVLRFFRWYIRRHLRRHFAGVLLLGELPELSEERPVVVFSAHPSWWDPLVFMFLHEMAFGWRAQAGPIDAGQLAKFPIFGKLGLFGIEPGTAAGAREFLTKSGVKMQGYLKAPKDDDAFIRAIDPKWSGELPALVAGLVAERQPITEHGPVVASVDSSPVDAHQIGNLSMADETVVAQPGQPVEAPLIRIAHSAPDEAATEAAPSNTNEIGVVVFAERGRELGCGAEALQGLLGFVLPIERERTEALQQLHVLANVRGLAEPTFEHRFGEVGVAQRGGHALDHGELRAT